MSNCFRTTSLAKVSSVNTILNNPNNKEILEEAESAQKETLGFVRGPEYYGGDIND